MIKRLQNNALEIANEIYTVFQLSYTVEAKLINANDFPPLNRPIEHYQKSSTIFFGYYVDTDLAGIIEIKSNNECTAICSLVVLPRFFRRGIAKSLLDYVFKDFTEMSLEFLEGLISGDIKKQPKDKLFQLKYFSLFF